MNRNVMRACLTGLALIVLSSGGLRPALAAPQRVTVSPFSGPGAEHLRTAMIARLPRRLQVLPVAQEARADAVVDGEIWIGKQWNVRLVVHNNRTGVAAGTLVWSGAQPRALMAEVLREAPAKLEARVNALARRQRVAAASRRRSSSTARRQVLPAAAGDTAAMAHDRSADTDSDADADAETPVARSEDGREPHARAVATDVSPLLEVSVGAGTIGRTLTFADNLSAAPGYSLPAASTLGGDLVVFPGARIGGGLGALGLAGAWETSIAAQTAGRDEQQSHPTRHLSYSFGARGRLPLGRATLLGGLDLGQQRFEVDLPGATLSPSVRYRFLRPSLGGRVGLDDFALSLSAAYLKVLAGSGLGGTVFPRAQVRGFEFGARLAYAIAPELAVDLRLDFRRFAHDMNARPGDAMLVGGAVDDYLAAALRLSYRVW